jgi:hypothetical protein
LINIPETGVFSPNIVVFNTKIDWIRDFGIKKRQTSGSILASGLSEL